MGTELVLRLNLRQNFVLISRATFWIEFKANNVAKF
jgi:hypothetical protein